MKIYPLLFTPVYVEKMWGGSLMKKNFLRDYPKTEVPIGESWEIVDRDDAQSIIENGQLQGHTLGELVQKIPKELVGTRHDANNPFPLLIKIIDAGKRLSLQVHPDNKVCKEYPNAEPKTEMWYILDSEKKAKIFAGLNMAATQIKFKETMSQPEVENLLNTFPSKQKDAYFIPTGRIHAIGGGNLIFEVQQNSDTTYRVSDWGRLDQSGKSRELHVKQALKSIHFEDKKLPKISGDSTEITMNKKVPIIMNCPYFYVEEIRLKNIFFDTTKPYSFQILTAYDNPFTLVHNSISYEIEKGRSCLLPAALGQYRIMPNKPVTIIRTALKRHF
ncbi:MAG: type I phosphomannose isomerase catalytic subunit [Verrucomicrobiota bacterium]|nr:type I phosphomannose isomerase catalytic subunit [Verrucomicrobiota bacterium]